ncbi:MAG: hypothetical protein KH375_04330 [Alistipes sp.]|nr:hypothetical protein [Alistipes sp.]
MKNFTDAGGDYDSAATGRRGVKIFAVSGARSYDSAAAHGAANPARRGGTGAE